MNALQRKHVLEWVRAMIAVTLGVKFNEELPPVYIQEPTDNAWSQIIRQVSKQGAYPFASCPEKPPRGILRTIVHAFVCRFAGD
eukprot:1161311-Pelagomonas_calceolata.AAC.8